MKIKLTPALAYIIGLWKARRTKEGIGIQGNRAVCELFLTQCLACGICQPDKVKFDEGGYEATGDSQGSREFDAGNFAQEQAQSKEGEAQIQGAAGKVGAQSKEGGTAGTHVQGAGAKAGAGRKQDRVDAKVYFYHSAYRAFFDDVIMREVEVFRYKNEYSINFFAGVYDGNGGVGKHNKLHYFFGSKEDEMALLRLGMRVKKEGRKVIFMRKEDFDSFLKPALKFAGKSL